MPYEPAGAPVSRRDLAAELRHLLLAAERRPGAPGRLKRSALARRLGVSASSLYAYLDGTTLPPAGVLARLLDALDVAEGERQRLASVRDSLDARRRSRTQPHRLDPMVPRHLPADVPGFTGRAAYLDRLDALLPRRGSGASTVVITAISGTAGVGKTALAVHWAHRVADRFPDGQLYVNLRGFHPTGSPVDPAVAVRGFLDALQVPPQRLPVSSEAQSALYRSLLAGRRMLVLLDNARDAEQVRPLLPGTPGCMVLVTSRNELSGLVAAEGARPLAVDLLTRAEARQMLEHRLGQHRLAAEPAAVDEIIARCARLPLALAIVAARAGIRATFPLAMLAAQLREAHGGLGEFADDDAIADLRAVFSWSYHSLGPAAARLFRQMGLHPGPDIAAPAAASLAGVPAKEGRALLTDLARAHLVTEHSPGRYTLHDLLRAYAGELARAMDSEADRRQAVHRMLDHYLHTAHRAALLLDPSRDPIALDTLRPGVSPEHLVDPERALAWFTAEHAVLISAVGTAAAAGRDIHTWQLSWTLATYLYRRGHNHDLVETQDAAVAAGHRLADPSVRARAHRELALPTPNWADTATPTPMPSSPSTRTGRPAPRSDRPTPTSPSASCTQVRAATPRRSTTPSTPSTCSRALATVAVKLTRRTRSGGTPRYSATTSGHLLSVTRPLPFWTESVTATVRPPPGTASGTPITTSVATPRPSRATGTASMPFARSATATWKPPSSPTSATPTVLTTRPTAPVKRGARLCTSSRSSATPTPTRCGAN